MDKLNTLDVKIDKNQQVVLQMKDQQNKLKVDIRFHLFLVE